MTIIGFNFTKISVEKHAPAKGKITVNRKATPVSVEEVQIGSGQKALRYDFDFTVQYEPKIAEMDFSGNITELASKEHVEEVLDSWKNNKKLPPATLEKIMNGILNKCHVEALVLSKELNVPAPFQLPKIKVRRTASGKTE